MGSRSKARNYLAIDRIARYRQADIDSLVVILDNHAKEAIEAHDAETCAWEYSDPGYNEWSSMCGASFRFDEGTVTGNGMKRCMRCGKVVIETINPLIDYENDEWKGND